MANSICKVSHTLPRRPSRRRGQPGLALGLGLGRRRWPLRQCKPIAKSLFAKPLASPIKSPSRRRCCRRLIESELTVWTLGYKSHTRCKLDKSQWGETAREKESSLSCKFWLFKRAIGHIVVYAKKRRASSNGHKSSSVRANESLCNLSVPLECALRSRDLLLLLLLHGDGSPPLNDPHSKKGATTNKKSNTRGEKKETAEIRLTRLGNLKAHCRACPLPCPLLLQAATTTHNKTCRLRLSV